MPEVTVERIRRRVGNPWAPRQTENAFLRQVVEAAELQQWAAYHTWRSEHSQAGFPDLVLVKPPRVIFAELKRDLAPAPKGKQALWLALLRACPGVETYVWRPRMWDDLCRILRS